METKIIQTETDNWKKIATGILDLSIGVKNTLSNYFLCFVNAGAEAPVAISNQDVKLDSSSGKQQFVFKALTDVYVFEKSSITPNIPGKIAIYGLFKNEFRSEDSRELTIGSKYGVSDIFQIQDEGHFYFYLDATFFGDIKTIKFKPIFVATYGSGPVDINLYLSPEITDPGTLVNLINRNFESAINSPIKLYEQPTFTSEGTLATRSSSYSNGVAANVKIGGSSAGEESFILARGFEYLLDLHNRGNSLAEGTFSSTWSEIIY